MKNINLLMAAIGCTAALSLMGCSNATVNALPTGKNTYSLVSLSSSEADSLKAATKKATAICTQMKKQLLVTSASTTYQGAYDKRTEKSLNVASDVASVATAGLVPWDAASSDNDYVTKMRFSCQ